MYLILAINQNFMRPIEIILKLLFLASSLDIIITKSIDSISFYFLLPVCLALGVTLIFNKKASYNYPQTKTDYLIRRIEGILLIVFSFSIYFLSI